MKPASSVIREVCYGPTLFENLTFIVLEEPSYVLRPIVVTSSGRDAAAAGVVTSIAAASAGTGTSTAKTAQLYTFSVSAEVENAGRDDATLSAASTGVTSLGNEIASWRYVTGSSRPARGAHCCTSTRTAPTLEWSATGYSPSHTRRAATLSLTTSL